MFLNNLRYGGWKRLHDVDTPIQPRDARSTGTLIRRQGRTAGLSTTGLGREVTTKTVLDHVARVFQGNASAILDDLFAVTPQGCLEFESTTDLAQNTPIPETVGRSLSSRLTLQMSAWHAWDAWVQLGIRTIDGEMEYTLHRIPGEDIDFRGVYEQMREVIWFAQALNVDASTFGAWKLDQLECPYLNSEEMRTLETLRVALQLNGQSKFPAWLSVDRLRDVFKMLDIDLFEKLTNLLGPVQAEVATTVHDPKLEYAVECMCLLSIVAKHYAVLIRAELASRAEFNRLSVAPNACSG